MKGLVLAGLLLAALPLAAQNHPELAWRELETEHFRIFFHEGLEAAAARAAEIAEAAYGPVTALYGYEPGERVRIVLKGYDDYANGAAYYYQDTIEIWTTALEHDFELRGTSDWLRNVITHEFTHIVSLGAARKSWQRMPGLYLQYFGYQRERNRPDILVGYPDVIASYPVMTTVVPMWFAEGVAQHMAPGAMHDRWDSHRDMVLRSLVLEGEPLSFGRMGVFGKCGFGNEYVYDHGYGLVRHIAEEYGDEKLGELARVAGSWRHMQINGIFQQVLGVDEEALYAGWVEKMRRQYEVQVKALGERVEGEVVAEQGFSNLRPAFSPDGRKLAYLSTRGQHYGPHLLVLRDVESGEEEVLTGGVASTVDWSPDGEKLLFVRIDKADKYGSRQADVYEYALEGEERGWVSKTLWTLPAMVSGYAPESPKIQRLTRGARAMYPVYSPDGAWIAFVRNGGASNDLGLMRSDGSEMHLLTALEDGTQLYTPRFSPDGKVLALSVARQGQRDIALLRVGEGERRLASAAALLAESAPVLEVVVATAGTDRDPAWSADGKKLYFVSDVSGIFNVYALEVETGRVRQVTNVLGGAFYPAPAPDGKVAFSSYGAEGYGIRRVDGEGWAVEGDFGGGERLEMRIPARSAAASQEYGVDFLKTSILPRLAIDEGHFKPGLYLGSGDVLGKQNLFAGAALAPANGDRDLFAIYEYRGLRPTLFLEVFNQRRRSARGDSSEARDLIVTGVNFSLNQISAGLRWPLGRRSELQLSATYDRYDASVESETFIPRRDGQVGFERFKQKPFGYTYLNGFALGATYRLEALARRRDSDINPRGRQLYFRYDRMYNFFIEGFNQNATFIDEQYLELFYNQFTLEWREHVGLPWNSTLGLRFYGGWIASDKVDDRELVNDFFDYHLGGLSYMKGYTFYSIEGRKAAMGTAALRFPILPDPGRRFMHLYLDKVYGAVYGDMGKAWDGKFDEVDPFFGRKGPLRDVGGQLRFDLVSYYSLPTRVQMDLAYGIDEVEDRNPWKFYLTVLFGYL